MQLLLLYIQIIPIFVVGNKQLLKYEVMKTKSLLFVFSLIGVATFSSCEKNLYDESKQPEKEKQVTDLNIPADFAWKLSKNTQCFVTSNAATDVEIFTDESCAENTKLATITSGNNERMTITTNLTKRTIAYVDVGNIKLIA